MHAQPLAGTGHPSGAAETPLRLVRACQASAPRLLPEPGTPTLLAYLSLILCTCSPLFWRSHLDAAGNPSFAVVDSTSAAAPVFLFQVVPFVP
jgi:hypothetical protein